MSGEGEVVSCGSGETVKCGGDGDAGGAGEHPSYLCPLPGPGRTRSWGVTPLARELRRRPRERPFTRRCLGVLAPAARVWGAGRGDHARMVGWSPERGKCTKEVDGRICPDPDPTPQCMVWVVCVG